MLIVFFYIRRLSSSRSNRVSSLVSVSLNHQASTNSFCTKNLEMGPEDSETMECKCGMPLCICVAPPKTSIPQATRAPPMALSQSDPKPKSDTSAKTKGSTSSSNARPDNPQKEYEVTGEGLREAIKNGDTAGVKKLLNEGVDPNYHDRQGMSVLHLAVLFNKTDIALMLMEHGASLEYKNAQGETPLDCAPATLQYKMREKMEKMMMST